MIRGLYFLLFAVISIVVDSSVCWRYHSNDEISSFMKNFSSKSKLNTRVFSIGKSVTGIPLNVLEINQPGNKIGIPNIKFIANIHGNEVVGREVLLNFMKFLDYQYSTRKLVKCLVDNTRIFILPTMNPDGFNQAKEGDCLGIQGRHNENGYDLNRNFPDYFVGNSYGVSKEEYEEKIQPEAAAIMKWMRKTQFTLSASLHGGTLVASYPFDSYASVDDINDRGEALTPDHDTIYDVSKTFVKAHERMSKGLQCPQDEFGLWHFEEGSTNGAQWYLLKGGMQDYNYIQHGCIEITLEISCCKYPETERLPIFLKENMEPLLQFGLRALRGVKGRVLDAKTKKPIEKAKLKIIGRKFPFWTTANGEFWRILKPDAYKLRVEAAGYETVTVPISVKRFAETECPIIPMTTIHLESKN